MTLTKTLLPDFIIIGAMKSGTTTLYRYLDRHPDIDMSRDKETDFFVAEKQFSNGLDWYSAQFSDDAAARNVLRGEASPNYTKRRDFAGVPERVAQTCPDVRLIYILRDPVARAESQFRHGVVMGEIDVTADGFVDGHEYAHIMDASRYAHQLDAWLAHFDRDRFLILDFDDLIRDPQAVMNQIYDHIGAAHQDIEDTGAANDSAEISRVPAPILRFAQSPVGRRIAGLIGRGLRDRIRGFLARGKSRTPPPLPEDLRTQMRRELAPDAARLRELSGLSFDKWQV